MRSCWVLLEAAEGCGRLLGTVVELLETVGGCLGLLGGGCWGLLGGVGGPVWALLRPWAVGVCWRLLGVLGAVKGCRRPLGTVGGCWGLLGDVGDC